MDHVLTVRIRTVFALSVCRGASSRWLSEKEIEISCQVLEKKLGRRSAPPRVRRKDPWKSPCAGANRARNWHFRVLAVVKKNVGFLGAKSPFRKREKSAMMKPIDVLGAVFCTGQL